MPASSHRFSTLRYSTLSSSEDLGECPGSHSPLAEYNHHKYNAGKTTARSNFYTLWKKSASHDCLSGGPSAAAPVTGTPALHPARKPPSGYLESLRSNTSNEESSVPKSDEGTWEINEPISGSVSYTSSSSPATTRNWCRNVHLPAYISTPDLLMEHGSRDSIIPVSEAPPCSFTLDSFMDIGSIDDPLETAWETDVPMLNSGNSNNNNNKQNALASFSSSNVFRPSSAANGSALLSIFESRRNKRLSLPRSPALSTQTNRRGFLNLNYIRNHQKSFFLPLQRLASSEVETEPRPPSLASQPTYEGQKKGLPALRKRISAVFRSDLWNQTHHPNNRNSLPYPGDIQDPHYNPFYHDDPFVANPLNPSASASAIPAFQVTPYNQLNPSIRSEVPLVGISTPRDNNAVIRSERLNTSSELSDASLMAATTFSLKDKPLPGIPVDQEVIDSHRSVVEEEGDMDDADAGTTSSCLECFTVLDEKWPEPPRHMIFLDPDMAEAFRCGGRPIGSNKMLDACTANKKYPRDSNEASDDHTLQTKMEETVKDLLSSFEIYLNGSRVTSQPPLPNTLIFPHDAITDPVQLGYTVGLTIRASARSQLISFCTLYADTTLTFEQPTQPSITTSKMQVGVSMKISHTPTQEEGYVEVSITIPDRDSKKETNVIPGIQSEGEQSPMDLVELPCTLGELAIIISKMAITV